MNSAMDKLEAKNQIGYGRKIAHIVGARPNIIKMAPVKKAIAANSKIEQVVIHTGQQFQDNMAGPFYDDFGIGRPDIYLDNGAPGMRVNRARRLAGMVNDLAATLDQEPAFNAIVVYGDTDSTLAGALAGAMCNIKVIHVEAGLRCWDRSLPEELNRILTDQIADIQLCYCHLSFSNLIQERTKHGTPILVGNVLADALQLVAPKIKDWQRPNFAENGYILATFHRPANVDNHEKLKAIIGALEAAANRLNKKVVLPMHPRTAESYIDANIGADKSKIIFREPQSYSWFIHYLKYADAVITDSGGVQEEATMLGVRCLTFRPNTERPITVLNGTNTVIGDNPAAILPALANAGPVGPVMRPPYWDAGAAKRIAIITEGFLQRVGQNGGSG